jgi:hypothetical protein
MADPVFKKPGMYAVALEVISTAYFINQPVCLHAYSSILASNRLVEMLHT